ncbi:MAG: 23S rRNA (adenine(2503)-C(2))-methyltransferase RlmN [Thermodesulfovibrionales bacterium]|nr:23S rRNA (adenine(2503)-C(2))-methyltransferase RlmN [Thermodesulfovibrionales bacterium]
MINLKSLNIQELDSFIRSLGLPSYRTLQLVQWIYEKLARDIDEITVFSKELRKILKERAFISNVTIIEKMVSRDGTIKYLLELEDKESIESVLIPDEKRLTLCISSQVGCPMGCVFCLTGKIGFRRNLYAHEIVDQVITVKREFPEITNVVFMGMGEPLLNLENTVESIRRLTSFMHFSPRKITVSTCGIPHKIMELYQAFPQNPPNIAISLNATTDETRSRLMPVNRAYPLKTLLDTLKKVPLPPRRRITFEYVLLEDINDRDEDAKRLVKLLQGIPSKINLIPFNPVKGLGFKRPSEERILRFQKILKENHFTALIRKSKGQDILAACGQLRARYGQRV